MKNYLIAAAIVASLSGAYYTSYSNAAVEIAAEYIIQGGKTDTIINNVGKVGGIVVHQYASIEAVSVKLTDSQLKALKLINPKLRPFKDTTLKVSSNVTSFSNNNLIFDLKEESVIWQGQSTSDVDTQIKTIDFNLPEANKKIKKIRINGEKIKAKKVDLNGTFTLDEKDEVWIAPGQAFEIEIEFDELEDFDTDSYMIAINGNAEATSVSEAPSAENAVLDRYSMSDIDASKTAGKIRFRVEDNSVSWKLRKKKDDWVGFTSLSVEYPSDLQSITSIKVDGDSVDYSIDTSGQVVFAEPVHGKKKKSVEIEVVFSKLHSVDAEDYSLIAHYSNGEGEAVVVSKGYREQGEKRDTFFPTIVRANEAHLEGLTGHGVTVAIIDTGISDLDALEEKSNGKDRNFTVVDVTAPDNSDDKKSKKDDLMDSDDNGHGTHLASIIANSSETYDIDGDKTGSYNGIAPDVNLVVVKAFDEKGQSSYLDVLKAVDYVIQNKDVLNIKVLNLSFSTKPSSYYFDDPLNKALMKAWQEGITVVAAAGNTGPEAMTIGVPGNTPYIITVGAISDNYTPDNLNDDFITSFSSAGPTYEGFVKPDLVAPGGHVQGLIDDESYIRDLFPVSTQKKKEEHDYLELSGSSQSTAVTSGVVALMLQANPDLSPDDVKCRLIASSRPATTPEGQLAVSMFQQGAGLIDAMNAIHSTASGCANGGLSIETELAGEGGFIGPARRAENDGDYYIPGVEGSQWSGEYSDTQLWRFAALDTDTQLWRRTGFDTDTQLWRRTGFDTDTQLWRRTGFDTNTQLWRRTGFDTDTQLWRRTGFDIDAQLWMHAEFDIDTQLWRRTGFDTNTQLWRRNGFDTDTYDFNIDNFNSNKIGIQWIDHE